MPIVKELWETHRPTRARLVGGRWLTIPQGETFEVAYRFDNGDVRIFWAGNREGLGGATVSAGDLEYSARPV